MKMLFLSNNWPIVLLIGIALSMMIGTAQYSMQRDLKIKKEFSDRVFSLMGKVFGVVIAVMVAFESTDGVLQVLDNLGGVKSDAWSLLLFPIAIFLVGLIVWAIITVAGMAIGRVKRFCLKSIRKDVLRKRQRDTERRHQQAMKKFEDIEQYKARKRVG